jgi:hypothetical protein
MFMQKSVKAKARQSKAPPVSGTKFAAEGHVIMSKLGIYCCLIISSDKLQDYVEL